VHQTKAKASSLFVLKFAKNGGVAYCLQQCCIHDPLHRELKKYGQQKGTDVGSLSFA